MPGVEKLGQGPLRDAGVVGLGVAELARLVDVLAGQADIFSRQLVPVRNMLVIGLGLDLTALLRGVVLIGEAALGRRLDLKRIGLSLNAERASFLIAAVHSKEEPDAIGSRHSHLGPDRLQQHARGHSTDTQLYDRHRAMLEI